MLTDEQVVEQHDDGEMIRRPHLWPLWPHLPLKRDPEGEEREHGLLIQDNWIGSTTVLLTNVILLDRRAERITYESVEAILADGWRVD